MALAHVPEQTELVTLPPIFPLAPAVIRILAKHDREDLAAFITIAIDLMDAMDGDADAENGTNLEDDFALTHIALGSVRPSPGCPIGDPDACGAHDDNPEILIGDDMPGDADDAEDYDSDACPAGDDGCAPIWRGGLRYFGSAEEDGDCEGWRQPVTLNPA